MASVCDLSNSASKRRVCIFIIHLQHSRQQLPCASQGFYPPHSRKESRRKGTRVSKKEKANPGPDFNLKKEEWFSVPQTNTSSTEIAQTTVASKWHIPHETHGSPTRQLSTRCSSECQASCLGELDMRPPQSKLTASIAATS